MMLKLRKFLIISILFCFCLSLTVSADNTVNLTLPEGFFVQEKEPEKVAQILNMNQGELSDYCNNNNILYLAVDGENSRQIRVSVSQNSFSNKIGNITLLNDDKIISLAPDISGIENIRGSVVKQNGQKFLKVQLKSQDGGGEYILTQFITISKNQNFVLSFYNNSDINTEYIDTIFSSLSSPLLDDYESSANDKNKEKTNILLVIIPVATIAFLIICVVLGISIILEIKRNKDEADIEYDASEEITDDN